MPDNTQADPDAPTCSSFCHFAEPCAITEDGRCETIAKLTEERNWLAHLVTTIRDKADLRYNGNRGLLAFSDLKDAAAKSMTNAPSVPPADEKAPTKPQDD